MGIAKARLKAVISFYRTLDLLAWEEGVMVLLALEVQGMGQKAVQEVMQARFCETVRHLPVQELECLALEGDQKNAK